MPRYQVKVTGDNGTTGDTITVTAPTAEQAKTAALAQEPWADTVDGEPVAV